MNEVKTSYICTVFNEEKTIKEHLNSLLNQSKLPDEIIIVDGGSTDKTASVILVSVAHPGSLSHNNKTERFWTSQNDDKNKKKKIKIKFIVKPGNRSVGRNEAIKQAKGDIILISDAGCTLNKQWVENIVKPFSDKSVDVVAGYYASHVKSIFQKCLIPYVLVMPDKVDPETFLPATRSMAIKKSVWEELGGFDERFSYNEDYVFAKQLRKKGYKIFFQKNALVYWQPRKTLKQAFIMFFNHALGDAESRIFRPKVILIFFRYLIFFSLLSLLPMSPICHPERSDRMGFFGMHHTVRPFGCGLRMTIGIIAIITLYILWSILKNYRYIKHPGALFWLPVLQITSDVAVLSGAIIGLIKILRIKKILKYNLYKIFI